MATEGAEAIKIKRYAIHPTFDAGTLLNDIAVLELATPVTTITPPNLVLDDGTYSSGGEVGSFTNMSCLYCVAICELS